MGLHYRFLWLSALMPLALLTIGQTCSAGLHVSCGEQFSCGNNSDSLIIFIGADRDLGNWGKVPELTQEFQGCGYNAVYFDPSAQFNDPEVLASWIRTAVKCRGQRVMLVGWSYGAVVGLKAMRIVAAEGICVDTFVELDCFNLSCHMRGDIQPSNAGRIVVIRSKLNRPIKGYNCPCVLKLNSCWHLGAPTHADTKCLLRSEANRFCAATFKSALLTK